MNIKVSSVGLRIQTFMVIEMHRPQDVVYLACVDDQSVRKLPAISKIMSADFYDYLEFYLYYL